MSESEKEEQNMEDTVGDNGNLEEKLEELIESVKKRNILYDPASVSNRNTYLKEQAWKEIGQEINMAGNQ